MGENGPTRPGLFLGKWGAARRRKTSATRTLSTRRNPMQMVSSASTHIVLATLQGDCLLLCLFLGFEGSSIAPSETFPSGPWTHRR